MNTRFSPRLDVLPPSQQALWKELDQTPSEFTLYGGTAIALQLGHRYSVDFDFFGFESFDPSLLFASVSFLRGSQISQQNRNTLTCIVDRPGPVQVSFFGIPGLRRIEAPRVAD